MTESLLLRDLGWILAGAALLALVARPLRVPGVVAYIAAGILLGPLTGLVEVTGELELLSELGVALLLFLVGLEMSVERVREVGGVAAVVGGVQLAVTFAAGTGLALLLGFPPAAATVTGLVVTFSSTAVAVKLLDQQGELSERHGRIALGILLVQDVAVVLALTVVGSLAGSGSGGGGSAVAGLLPPFLVLGGLGVATMAAARWLLPPLFGWVRSARETLMVWSLSWCMLFVLVSELVHLPLEIGAFLAGIGLAQLPEAHDLGRRVAPLTNFFLAVFFVALGIQIDPGAAISRPGQVVTLVLFVLLGKAVLFFWLLARRGEDERTAFRTAVALCQVSEFSFVLAALAAAAGFLGATSLSVLGAVGLITIAVSSVLLIQSESLHARARQRGLLRVFRAPAPMPGVQAETRLEGHVVVVGMNALGRKLVTRLAGQGRKVVAVDRDPEKLAGLPCPIVIGDVEQPEVLAEAALARAGLLVSALQIEEANKLLAHRSRRAGVPSAIHAFNPIVEEELEALGVDHLMDSKDEGARRIGAELRALGVLGGA